ncbi:T9SS type A sorting domain-containing protein [Psychroserpens burtonensis]|uniref:T9SS type A sorting domain-containing protein n=1 Tax=Psychroserpens burtonensis TaxID=49278 RepID=A0A5C7B3P8_9FLAO|nr:T9SS type A sorting domain-containing protein [Psychroserpens burtonensis]TXE15963.1 T9SS type A sorting domain-containing protein [Psychroserpens burtonensis]
MKNHYLLVTFLLSVCAVFSQDYKQMISEGTHTVQDIQIAAEAHFSQVGTARGKGFKPYKRWEYQALRQMNENGMLPSPDFYFTELENYNSYLNEVYSSSRTTVGSWEQLGPESWNATSGWNPGVGRITSVAIEPTNPNHIIAGANTGGVWKSTDGGLSWIVLTDNLSNLNVSSLTIHPTINTTYYWGSTSGTIFVSADSGATWNLLADTGNGNVNKILIDPSNTNKMYCSVQSGGLYKSTDAGVNWTKILPVIPTGYDFEFKPDGLYSTIYATGNDFFVSTNSGDTWTGRTGFGNGPKMIGVSASNPEMVYVLEADNGSFGNLYKSVNSSVSFTTLSHTDKNYFGYSSDSQDPGDAGVGQAPRDMDIAVNPLDAFDVHIAGINSWRSTDGGLNFSITSQWTPGNANGQNIGYCHADIDILEFVGTPTDGYKLYVGSDGGLFVAENPTVVNSQYYKDLTTGMGIRQFYKIGISQTNPVVVTGGSQDNGSSVMDVNGDWTDWLGADGMEGFIDKDNTNIMYGTSQFGTLYKSFNGGLSISGISSPDGKSGNWVTPFEQDPILPNVIYVGYDEVYKSTNGGNSWISVSQDFGPNINHLKIAPSSSNYQFAARGSNLYRNSFVGTVPTWSSISGFSGSINSIAIHPTNPNKVAIATTGTQRVYMSSNGGNSWTSYKLNLPNFSAQALAWGNNDENGLYLGMDYGVYYIDDTFTEWQPFSNGLPNVNISELEVNTVDGKLYAGTYGRGLWASELFDATLSVDEFALESFVVYPNPAKNQVTLQWDKADLVSVRVFDALGKLMYFTKNIDISQPTQLDVSNYASGIYFVKINNRTGFVTKKLIIE